MTAIQLTKESFDQTVLTGGKTALVEFWAPWCTYCRRIAPAMTKLAEEADPQLVVGQVNIDEQPELADRYQVEVIPTLLVFRDGKPGQPLVAPGSKAQIDDFLASQR